MERAVERRTKGTILVIEDDVAARFALVTALRARGYAVDEAATMAEALRLVASVPDVVLTDLRLPDGDAIGMLPRLRAVAPAVRVYVMTGFATIDVAVRAVKEGADEFFTKPLALENVLRCVDEATNRRPALRSGRHPRVQEEPVWSSEAMRRLEDELDRLRDSDCSVLILGETGTGKTRLARRIHELGARGKGPFVDVNCAGLSRDFVESELFGHERGAFTGAHAPKPGLFDAANGGTIFLDEIGDIDLQVQPKILKVLEERRYRRMGDVREREADVRLLAATHKDLLAAVETQVFRADLYYRISTVTLHMPALRERREDLDGLARELLRQSGAGEVELARSAREKLEAHAWPGNVRELRNVLQRALLARRGPVLHADDVRFDGEGRTSGTLRAVAPPYGNGPVSQAPRSGRLPEGPPSSTLEEMERVHIKRALAAEGGRVKDAAQRLGIPRSTLYQKIKNYGIRLPYRDSSIPPGEGEG